jgi:hypothetical protein
VAADGDEALISSPSFSRKNQSLLHVGCHEYELYRKKFLYLGEDFHHAIDLGGCVL